MAAPRQEDNKTLQSVGRSRPPNSERFISHEALKKKKSKTNRETQKNPPYYPSPHTAALKRWLPNKRPASFLPLCPAAAAGTRRQCLISAR